MGFEPMTLHDLVGFHLELRCFSEFPMMQKLIMMLFLTKSKIKSLLVINNKTESQHTCEFTNVHDEHKTVESDKLKVCIY